MVGRRRPRGAAVAAVFAALALAGPEARAAGPGTPAGAAEAKRRELRIKAERTFEALSSDLAGATGYAIRDLQTGETFEARGDAVFPAASTIKLPILLALYREAEEGGIDLSASLPIDPAARVEGGGVLEKWSPPYPGLSAAHLAVLMIDFSDNWATNLLIERLGFERIGRRLKEWGLTSTLLRRKMMDVDAARAGRENVTTPRDMVAILERLQARTILDEARTRQALDLLRRNEDTPLKRGLPPGVEVADKSGELEGVRCDSGLLLIPGRPVAIAVMTAYLRDEAAGERYIGAMGRTACDYFTALARGAAGEGRLLGP